MGVIKNGSRHANCFFTPLTPAMENEMEAKRDLSEWLHNHTEFAAPLERLVDELDRTREGSPLPDDMEDRLREAQR
jgi:hypothetical protein